jgi:hypothetical protein
VKLSIKKPGINAHCKDGQADDANAILQDHQEESAGQEHDFLPETPKAEMGGQ